MIEKIYLGFIGVVIVAVAAAAGVVAACYALFEALREPVGPAGAAGLVALAIFLLIGLGALLLGMRNRPAKHADDSRGLSGKVLQLARDKPLIAVGALVAAGIVVARNPRLATAVVSAFMAGQSSRKS
ncbi:MAG: hypothetical protein ACK4YQ_01730 [Phenylobacterium sp.]|uniref:hypothetical protein n=1 Tax=Phenylobacterium sp. TaxID=1871053 RepID=UPI00391CDF28